MDAGPVGCPAVLPFNGNLGPVAEADARRTQAAARFTAVQARAIGEIDGALAGYQAALESEFLPPMDEGGFVI